MSKQYAVYPGKVLSINDGERHHVTAVQLIRLYGVPRNRCVIIPDHRRGRMVATQHYVDDLIPLYPDPSGQYEVPDDGDRVSAHYCCSEVAPCESTSR